LLTVMLRWEARVRSAPRKLIRQPRLPT
jgi:hypothetical protein